jgi:hypothetical protein
MERERWIQLYALAEELSKNWWYGRYCVYSVAVIVGVYLWACLHDRPISWACRTANWPDDLRPGPLPPQWTMSRRLRSEPVRCLLDEIERQLGGVLQGDLVKIIDAKPLLVGGCSKARDAKWGRAGGGHWRGYKFYAIWGQGPLPLAWTVDSMNVDEQQQAQKLIPHLRGRGFLLGDNKYDSSKLFDLAAEYGHQLIAPRQHPKAGLGHCYQSPYRIRSIDLLRTKAGKRLFQKRVCIERYFGNWTSFAGGLAPLPSWVRNLPRVRMWIQAKLLINALRVREKPKLAVA